MAEPVRIKRSRVNTRARLVSAAFDVIAERGFAATTVEDVCTAAGFTRGAFYSNFTSMEELFFEIYSAHAAQLIEGSAAVAEAITSESDVLAAIVASTPPADESRRKWFLVSAEFTLHAVRNPRAAALLAQHRAALRAELGRLIEVVLQRSGRRLLHGLDVETFARIIQVTIDGPLGQIFPEPDDPGVADLPEKMLLSVVFGATEPGSPATRRPTEKRAAAPAPDRAPKKKAAARTSARSPKKKAAARTSARSPKKQAAVPASSRATAKKAPAPRGARPAGRSTRGRTGGDS